MLLIKISYGAVSNIMKDFNLGTLLGEIKKSKSLFKTSAIIIIIIAVGIWFLYDRWEGLEKVFTIVGFVATLYSVVLTIILYNFLNIADAEFIINSQRYVDNNKGKIIQTVLSLGNFMRDNYRDISDSNVKEIKISNEIQEAFMYTITINKSYINERTALYQCRESFKKLELLINETHISKVADLKSIEADKAHEITQTLLGLVIELNTIFNKK